MQQYPLSGTEAGPAPLPWCDAAPADGGEPFGQALEACRQYLRMLAVRELGSQLTGKEGVSDLVQETFLEAHRDRGRFRGRTRGEFLAWLRGILRHNAANLARRYRAGARSVGREVRIDAGPHDGALALADRGDSPSGHASAREQAEALRRAVERLPEHYRRVLTWRHHDQLSYPEIAERLGSTPDAARMLWARAVRRVQAELSGERPAGGDRAP